MVWHLARVYSTIMFWCILILLSLLQIVFGTLCAYIVECLCLSLPKNLIMAQMYGSREERCYLP